MPPPSPFLTFTFACTRQDGTCYALAQFYEATNGAGWSYNGGWSAARAGAVTDYCSFHGAACNSNNALTELCVCTASLCLCVSLRPLYYSNFYGNQLTGSLPSSVGSLTALQQLCVHARRRHGMPHC